jgi:hypothetical protein
MGKNMTNKQSSHLTILYINYGFFSWRIFFRSLSDEEQKMKNETKVKHKNPSEETKQRNEVKKQKLK